MTQYKYTLMNRGEEVISTNDISLARDGVRELGHRAYVQYNMHLNWTEAKLRNVSNED